MHVFEMVIWIVLIGCATGVITSYFEMRKKEAENPKGGDVNDAELAAMRDRIEALETILTDQRVDLKTEIERLERQA